MAMQPPGHSCEDVRCGTRDNGDYRRDDSLRPARLTAALRTTALQM